MLILRRTQFRGATLTRPDSYGSSKLVAVVALAKGASEERVILAVRRVAEAATDFSWLSQGDVVFIKVAANSPNKIFVTFVTIMANNHNII
jgi:hypothetical protein